MLSCTPALLTQAWRAQILWAKDEARDLWQCIDHMRTESVHKMRKAQNRAVWAAGVNGAEHMDKKVLAVYQHIDARLHSLNQRVETRFDTCMDTIGKVHSTVKAQQTAHEALLARVNALEAQTGVEVPVEVEAEDDEDWETVYPAPGPTLAETKIKGLEEKVTMLYAINSMGKDADLWGMEENEFSEEHGYTFLPFQRKFVDMWAERGLSPFDLPSEKGARRFFYYFDALKKNQAKSELWDKTF